MKKAALYFLLIIFVTIGVFYFYSVIENKQPIDKNAFFNKVKTKTLTQNKFIYLNVWNTKCAPCIEEMPILDSIAKKYNSKIDFVFISDDSDEKVNRLLNKKSLVMKNSTMLNDEDEIIDLLCKEKNLVKSYPIHFIIDEKLNIVHYHTGAIMGTIFDPILMSALNRIAKLN